MASDDAPPPHRHPPIRVSPDGVEPEPHRVGHRWLDLLLAGSAILISVISLSVAIEHGHTMEKLVAANSWPLLQAGTSNIDDQGKPVIALSIENVGVGPAVVKSFSMTYKGRRYNEFGPLLRDCCGYSPAPRAAVDQGRYAPGDMVTSSIARRVIKAGESRDALRLEPAGDGKTWARLNDERFRIDFDACYCSVFDTCWRSDLGGTEPKEVKECPAG